MPKIHPVDPSEPPTPSERIAEFLDKLDANHEERGRALETEERREIDRLGDQLLESDESRQAYEDTKRAYPLVESPKDLREDAEAFNYYEMQRKRYEEGEETTRARYWKEFAVVLVVLFVFFLWAISTR